jgi:uncharacterized membrane protein YkvA (DUF1232 family)
MFFGGIVIYLSPVLHSRPIGSTADRWAGKKNKRGNLKARILNKATMLKNETYAVYIAARDPRVPWYAKALLGLILAYALSPIDLIPDFVPVLGYLDDLIIVPLGIAIAIKMIPPQVMIDARKQAEHIGKIGKPISKLGILIIIGIWFLSIALVAFIIYKIVK